MDEIDNNKQRCAHCGSWNEAEATVCHSCGEPLLQQNQEAIAEEPAGKGSQPYRAFSILSFGISILSLGCFQWIAVALVDIWGATLGVAFRAIIICLFLLIALCGVTFGAVSLKKGKKWLAIIGITLSAISFLFISWIFANFVHFYYCY